MASADGADDADRQASAMASDHLAAAAGTPLERRHAMNAAIARTAFQRKAVTRLGERDVIDLATTFFRERGYRVGRTGRPGQMFVMGGAEGELPRVTGEVNVQTNVGRAKSTFVRLDAAGERLGPAMAEFYALLRAQRAATRD